jgi:thiol-disulfide isomerase/thioredoxin
MTRPTVPPKGWSRRQVLAGASAALMAPLGAALAATASASASASPPVNWSSLHLLGEGTDGPAAWAGLPVVVVFWATWCPYCKRHNAHMEKLYQYSLGKSFRVLGVSADTDAEKISRYLFANQFHFPVAMGTASFRAQFTARSVIPLTCLVDADGRLMQSMAGEMQDDDVMSLAIAVGSAKPRIEPVSLLIQERIWVS